MLFINSPVPAMHREIMAKYDIIAVPYSSADPMQAVSSSGKLGDGAALHKYHPSTTRWVLFYEYMMVRV